MRRRSTQSTIGITQSVRRLGAYIPTTLAAQILREGLPDPGVSRRLMAATLFCDLTGFTTMTNELAEDGPRGAEELNRVLLMTFTSMINSIHTSRGAVAHFHGDAMMVYFPDDDGEAATRALACARFMQGLMRRGFGEVKTNRPPGRQTIFHLGMKIGVGYGRCLEIVVGDPEHSLEFVLAGPAVEEAVAAQMLAREDQVMASETVLRQAGLPAAESFTLLTEVMPVPYAPPILFWASYEKSRLRQLSDAAAMFMHPALRERIMDDKLAFVAEHRPVTSMFVRFDGIDYEADGAGPQLQAYYQWAEAIVERFGGYNSRLNRVLTGDKGSQLHILFGAPVAPDAPDQALRCALALQAEKPDFISSQKIGVAAGKVFTCAVGAGNRREYTALGDVVNLSSRLTSSCPEGAVLTDKATLRRVQDRFEFEELSADHLKGFHMPVAVYQICGEQRAVARLQRRFIKKPLLPGREAERQKLLALLNRALAGQPGVAVIHGPVGVGRSRLLAAGVTHWLAANGLALAGMGQQHMSDLPFNLWIGIWRDFFGLQGELDVNLQAEQVVRQVRELCPEFAPDVTLWLEAMGLPLPDGVAPAAVTGADMRRRRLFRLVRLCLEQSASENPLLLALEDVHWTDELSLALLQDLTANLSPTALFVAVTCASLTSLDRNVLQSPLTTAIGLSELSLVEGRQLVQRFIDGAELPDALAKYLGLQDDREHINPLFLEESINMLVEMGVLRFNGELSIDERELAQMRVPDTIYSIMLTRLDRLSVSARSLIEVASVIGRQFELETLVGAADDIPPDILELLLDELNEAQLIHPVTTSPSVTFLFTNDMVREVAYQSIPYARRQILHASVANSIVAQYKENLRPFFPVLAYHYGHTDLHEYGLQYAVGAADDARAIYATQAAIEMYHLAESHLFALGSAADWKLTIHVLLSRAAMQRMSGQIHEAIQDTEQALAISLDREDALLSAQACNLLAELKARETPGEVVLSLTNTVIHELPRGIPPGELARAWVTRAEALTYLGKFHQAKASLAMAVDLYEMIDDTAGLVRSHLLWGYEYCGALGEWSEARYHYERAQDLLKAMTDAQPENEIQLCVGWGQLAIQERDFETARGHLQRASQLADIKSIKWWKPAIYHFQSEVLKNLHDIPGAHAMLHIGLKAVEDGGNADYLPLLLLSLAAVTTERKQKLRYLTECRRAARARARHLDRERCFTESQELGQEA